MTLLAAFIVVLIVLVVLDLALTAAVIRKLRQHDERLAGEAFDPRPAVVPGTRLPAFTVVTTAGAGLSEAALRGRTTVLVFISTTCASCTANLPALREYLTDATRTGLQAWAVVAGAPDAVATMVSELPPEVEVINEGVGGPLHGSVRLQAYPGFVVVAPDGTVERVASTMDGLPRTPLPVSVPAGPTTGMR
ncbi:MAG TPA: redoxin domain-containing protein [Catenuloplanes sp.]|jgi:hypothetical protein